jgi:hypothetical protein
VGAVAAAAWVGTGLGIAVVPATAQTIEAAYDRPARDRWNYPFNFQPGARASASVFRVPLDQPGFDDRDAEFIVGFDTAADIPTGLSLESYRIESVVVTATVEIGDQFIYDESFDSYRSLLATTDGEYQPDADGGRPVELFGVGYRNGFTLMTWQENSPFGGTPVVPPAQGARNAFPAVFDAAGVATDVSNSLKERFDPQPMAIGTAAGVAPGSLVPADTTMAFAVDLSEPTTVAYLRRGLAAGRLHFVLTSMQATEGGPGGGSGDPNYPVFYTKENPLSPVFGYEPTLTIRVRIGSPADLNGDGVVDFGDVAQFVSAFAAMDPVADINGDGIVDFGDVGAFVSAFNAG